MEGNGEFRTVIPANFRKTTGDYLEEVTRQYTFSERDGMICYGDLPLFDVRPAQPEINLFTIRFDSATAVQSMVKYIEIKNAFCEAESEEQFVVFIADNALEVSVSDGLQISINKIAIEVATVYFNEAISFVPCFSYVNQFIVFHRESAREH